MGIARSTYYRETVREKKQLESDLYLRGLIQDIHEIFPGYGYRRMREHLLRDSIVANGKRIRRVMKKYGIVSSRKKAVGPKGTRSIYQLYYPNLTRGLRLSGPNQLWATDITFISLLHGYVYLSAVIDVYTRKVVGWAVSKNLSHKFCLKALEVAIKKQNPPTEIIHHSDRGTQYTCDEYVGFLKKYGFKISMSGVGVPQDNSFIEAFFKTLKHEEIYAKKYRTMRDVINRLPAFIDDIYNFKRLHSSLGYKTPDEFERSVMELKPADRPIHKLWGWAA